MRMRIAITLTALFALCLAVLSSALPGVWLTIDQRAMRLLQGDDAPAAAAELFEEPAWKATAFYRAGDFERSQAIFSGIGTPEAAYNRGNALVFMGRYEEAVASYDRALASRPGWRIAIENRAIAQSRQLDQQTGEGTGGQLGADEIVFDDTEDGAGEQTVDAEEGEPIEGAELNAMWLRNVKSDPGEFLRLKFAYQFARPEEDGGEE